MADLSDRPLTIPVASRTLHFHPTASGCGSLMGRARGPGITRLGGVSAQRFPMPKSFLS